MKKQRSPVILGSIVAVLIIGMAAWNLRQAPGAKPEEGHQQDVTQKEVTPEQRQKIGSEMAKAIKELPAGEVEDRDTTIPKEPTILLPKFQKYKPQPNDGNIATQWYEEESNNLQKMKKTIEERGG